MFFLIGVHYCPFKRMNRYRHPAKVWPKDGVPAYPPPFLNFAPSYGISVSIREDAGSHSSSLSSVARINPAVLFIVVMLAVLFFVSGLLHLLMRFLIRHPPAWNSQSRRYPGFSSSDSLRRQLQQLFHLHDSGLDQAVIDSLPVFQYGEIVGLREPFDCVVCLCAFREKDQLRLLPVCRHAFHINCIDTWLLTNSTCPLCRGALFASGLAIENPIFDFDELPGNGDNGSSVIPIEKATDIDELFIEKGAVPVKLGKFRKISKEKSEGGAIGETSGSNLDARRCYSMGSYQYVLGDSELRVSLNSIGSHVEDSPVNEGSTAGKSINTVAKGESYSVSKIWLWLKRGKFSISSQEQFSTPPSLKIDIQ